MTGANKILTVSYGTFSCTLEGFNDPFSTMKAIAEYFRDLAADDRYFGAEPPTPDAAMLHRIAEREIQRRVEAKIQENGVVLRAAEGEDAGASVTIPAAPRQAPAPVATPVLADRPAESVAEKLSRLRAEAAAAAAAAEEEARRAAAEPPVEAPTATDALLAGLLAETAPAEPAETPVMTDDFLAETALLAAAQPDEVALVETVVEPAMAADDTLPEDEPEEPEAFDIVALAANLQAETPTDDTPDAVAQDEAEAEDSIASIFAQPEDDLPEAAEAEDTPRLTDDLPEDADDAADAALLSVFAQNAEDEAPGPAPVLADDLLADRLPEDEAPAAPAVEEEAAAAPDLRPEAAEKLQRARARVIRIRRGETAPTPVEAEAQATIPQPEPEIEAQADIPHEAEAAILTPEAEADLEAELAALREEMAIEEPAPPAPAADLSPFAEAEEDEAPALTQTDTSAMARAALTAEAADDAVSRLMAQADEAMEGPENKRRLSAIAHLKAAVAATAADRAAARDLPPAEPSRLSRYRDDLARVVRAKLGVPHPDGDTGPRPAPLVLVSEQRVNRASAQPSAKPATPLTLAPAPTGPAPTDGIVRPRRVAPAVLVPQASVAEAEEGEDEPIDAALIDVRGFTEFAERLGARTLPELIEASAAYLSIVQKREAFSRPQLMANVQAALPDDLPREDGLRSFGALLRSGRLSKLKRGQFVLSQQSTYLNEGKRIAG